MASNFRTIYLYIVSFITLVMIIGGIVSTVNNITSYFFPDSYVFYKEETSNIYSLDYEDKYQDDYEDTRRSEIRRQNYKTERIKNTVVSLVVIAVGGIMYKYHWNIIEKERVR